MNKLVLILFFGGVCLSAYAHGGDMSTKSLPMTTVINNLESQGYTAKEIEFKDNAYHVEAIDKQGKEVDVVVNSETGALQRSEKSTMTLTMQDAVKKVEAAGYHSIYEIKMDDDKYEVKALNKEGKKVSLDVNGQSGEISKNLF